MAVQKIEYPNKVRGDLFTNADATEVKQVVNHNADELAALAGSVGSMGQSLTSMSQSMSDLKEEQKQLKVAMIETTASVEPGKLYVWGSVTGLNLTLAGSTAGLENEYKLRFTAGDGFKLTLSETVRWVDEPEWTAGWTYEVSIEDGLAVCAGWEAQGR
ncbi:MAG: hypothetical protein II826_09345 [Prevotella sp.]|nr:hypothetical protein [Prevotella sp.]